MRFNPNDYGSNTVMHCDTEEKATIFCSFLHSLGKRWCDDTSYLSTHYNSYKSEMCYRFHIGRYASRDYYTCHRSQILEFDDFEWDNYTPPEKEKPVKLRFSW